MFKKTAAEPEGDDTLVDRIGYRLRSRIYEMCKVVEMAGQGLPASIAKQAELPILSRAQLELGPWPDRFAVLPDLVGDVPAESVEELLRMSRISSRQSSGLNSNSFSRFLLGHRQTVQCRSPRCSGTSPMGVSRAPTRPLTRSMIHFRTRMLSPNPGQMNLPFSSIRNQLTEKIFGRLGDVAAHVDPVAEVVAHVVAAEGQHGDGVAAQHAHLARPPRSSSPSPSGRP